MDVHELVWKAAEIIKSKYYKNGDISIVDVPVKEDRKQVVYTKLKIIDGEKYGLVFSKIGKAPDNTDVMQLLKINYFLNYSRISMTPDGLLCVLSSFTEDKSGPFDVSKIIKEVAQIADDIEKDILKLDVS
jgi:hypothetical protein